jgi:hypothetical protein
MKITMTIREIMNMYLWEHFCNIRHWDLYIVNEGLVDSDEEVELTNEECEKLHLVVKQEYN